MNDKLNNFLDHNNIPEPSENARKTALNMASAEFKDYQAEKNQKKSPNFFQGFLGSLRLMSKTNSQDRRTKMKNRKFIYGGMATAMVVVLAGGTALYQTRTHEFVTGQVAEVAKTENLFDQYQDAISSNETNKPIGKSYIPTPTGSTASDDIVVSETDSSQEKTLVRWRLLQEERAAQQRQQIASKRAMQENEVMAQPLSGNEVSSSMRDAVAETEIQSDPLERRRLLQEEPARTRPLGTKEKQALQKLVKKGDESNTQFDHFRAAIAQQELESSQALSGNIASDMIAPYPQPLPVPMPESMPPEMIDNDKFEDHKISSVKQVSAEPVSTFSIDVDTASYSFVRRQLNNGVMPNPDAVRIEEMVNYFPYDYQGPENAETPFNANVAVLDAPWKEGNKLIHIGIKGYDIDADEQPSSNLVFLLDVSGSMNQPDKLPLLKNSFKLLLNTLKPDDTISIVTYAGRAGTALEPTKVKDKSKIMNALESLRAGGSTAGAAGIEGAYALAEENFIEDGVNRIILATDGDFNVGASSNEELKELIEEKRKSGIFLSVLGFGQGNLNDHLMQTLAQNGNGIAAHIDSLSEAQKVLVDEATSSLFPIAKDVKIQVEFNPEIVSEYRLIGYETRALAREDFNNDKVDAGDIGAGHTVTAIYEIVPKGSSNELYGQSRYAKVEETDMQSDFGSEYAFLKMRYKLPNEDTSTLVTTPISKQDQYSMPENCGPDELCKLLKDDVTFSLAVAGFGQLLKDDKYIGNFDYDDVLEFAAKGKERRPLWLSRRIHKVGSPGKNA